MSDVARPAIPVRAHIVDGDVGEGLISGMDHLRTLPRDQVDCVTERAQAVHPTARPIQKSLRLRFSRELKTKYVNFIQPMTEGFHTLESFVDEGIGAIARFSKIQGVFYMTKVFGTGT